MWILRKILEIWELFCIDTPTFIGEVSDEEGYGYEVLAYWSTLGIGLSGFWTELLYPLGKPTKSLNTSISPLKVTEGLGDSSDPPGPLVNPKAHGLLVGGGLHTMDSLVHLVVPAEAKRLFFAYIFYILQ